MKLSLQHRLVIAASLVLISLASSFMLEGSLLANFTMITASLVAVWPIAKKAFEAARYKIIGIDILVSIAALGAIIIGEYWEAAAVAILFLLGEYLEARALEKTRSAIKSLLDLSPQTARVIRNDQEIEIPAIKVSVGEKVIIKPGEKIAVDGIVQSGEAYVDQSSITGESMPISLKNGANAYSGTIVESGYLEVTAAKVGEDTMFSRILHLVEEAQDNKARTQAFLERFSKYYTPAVMALSLVVLALTQDVYLALTLLVIACPGALVIAVPVSIVAGIGNAAKNGILIKGGEAIEYAARADVIAFDKTGTLTLGQPKLIETKVIAGDKRDLLSLAASAEYFSEHPLAQAIILEAKSHSKSQITKPDSSDIVIGQGVVATIGSDTVLVGNHKLLAAHNIDLPPKTTTFLAKQQAKGHTAVLVASGGTLIGALVIADTVRSDAPRMIAKLHRRGKRVVMLTGDSQVTAQTIANKLGIDSFYAELSPEDKVQQIQSLKTTARGVIMVGDGVNDAPALASADLGIAVGGPGKDVAMETADIVLLSGNIAQLNYALDLARATTINMRQNIYFAVITVILLLIGVLAQVVFLSSGMLIHVVSVLLVIFNALRLLSYTNK